ncbi:MAG: hypothetical protein KGZ79_07740 [Dethiobacter sp.]|jgi:tRNA-guanine family transglycosylase|nr:hypothetical protein [Dethiobacter sp.]
MIFFISWSHSDPVYSDYYEACNMLISPAGVSSGFKLGAWDKQPDRVMLDSGAYYYLTSTGPPVTQSSVFRKQLRMFRGVRSKTIFCHLDHPISPRDSSQVSAFLAVERTLGNACEFMELYRRHNLHKNPLLQPLAVIQGVDADSIRFCAGELEKMGFELFGLGSLAPLYNPAEIMERIKVAAQVVGGENLHIFGISRLDVISQLKKYRIRSLDSTRPIKAAIHNAVFYSNPFRTYGIDGSRNADRYPATLKEPLPCPCPTCREKTSLLLETGSKKSTNARALHNYYHLVRHLTQSPPIPRTPQ